MQELEAPAANPEIKELVVEASRALARLDAPRLEELALSCEALNRDLDSMDAGEKSDLARQAREAAPGMAVLGRVLAVTRANQNVMRRLREMRERRLEYSERLIRASAEVVAEAGKKAEAVDGDD
ncbi:MAG: hypothetical protein ABSF75_04915 [Terracidiphilus sp.]|jgi:hypothetical protein